MLKCSGTNISITRGDSAYITLTILDGSGNKYQFNDGDKISIDVRTKPNTGKLVFNATIDIVNGEIVWHILPENTRNLQVKTYYWDAQLTTSNGDVFTFITSSSFRLLDEVTYNEQ